MTKTKSEITSVKKKNDRYTFFYHVDSEININNDTRLTFDYHGEHFTASIEKTTITDKDVFDHEEIYIVATPSEKPNEFTLRVAVSKGFYDMFGAFVEDDSDEPMIMAMLKFLSLNKNKRNEIKERVLNGKKYPLQINKDHRTPDLPALEFEFNLYRSTYTPEQQIAIEGIIKDCKSSSLVEKMRAIRRLSYIIGINPNDPMRIELTKSELVSRLRQRIDGLDNVIDKIAEAIIASKYSDIRGFNILLVGNPGCGKTALIDAIAQTLNRPSVTVPLGSLTDMVDVSGDAPHFEASDCGIVIKAYYRNRTTSIVVGLDEYDKPSKTKKSGYNITQAFNDALSDEHKFYDNFIGCPVDCSNTIFIATANSTDEIPEHLLNRFTVIHIPEYTDAQKVHIAKFYLLPELLNRYHINSDKFIIDDDMILYIAKNFCEDCGARDLKSNLKTIIDRVLTIWDEKKERDAFVVDKEFIDNSLERYVNRDSPAIIYRRNSDCYSERNADEIKRLILNLKKNDIDQENREKLERKLNYLVHFKNNDTYADGFDVDKFYECVNRTHYGMESVKNQIATTFYASSASGKPLANNHILLVGPPGMGKTSIAESIAAACHRKFAKISLNGVNDSDIIKGYPFTCRNADAGRIIKSLKDYDTEKYVILLDELDKLEMKFGDNVFDTIVDLLDDSSEFTDNFLDVPVDISNVLFIATANDLSRIPHFLTDRFTVITMDGYTEKEKAHILKEYVVPESISDICSDKINLSFSDAALKLITGTYCKSMGIRDAKRAVRKIIKDVIFKNRSKETAELTVTEDDVKVSLGLPPAVRGNFPDETYPGLSRALAVTGDNCGMSFAIETMLIPNDNTLTITGLPKESAIDSVKLAISYIKCHYPGILDNKGIHVHFGEGAVTKDGPSAGVAILISMLSAAFDTPVTGNVAYTGEINGNAYIFNIGGTKAKIQAALQSGCSKVFIPYGNYKELDDDELAEFNGIEIVPVNHISQVISAVLPNIACTPCMDTNR